jgi:predicted permease
MLNVFADTRSILRALVRDPRFALTAVCILAPAAAVAGLLFNVASLAVWKPPVDDGARLVYVDQMTRGLTIGLTREAVSVLQGRRDIFETLAYKTRDRGRSPRTGSKDLVGEMVSGGYFDVLGVHALVGRAIDPRDDQPSASPAIVISERFWRQFFAGASDVLGTTLALRPTSQGVHVESVPPSYVIVGVMPDAASHLASPFEQIDYWVPVMPRIRDYACDVDLSAQWVFTGVGRLSPTITPAQAEAAIWQVWRSMLERDVPGGSADRSIRISSTPSFAIPTDRTRIGAERVALLTLGLAMVLLAATLINLSGLLMLRVVRRLSDDAIRTSLGADPWRASRVVLIEALMVGVAAAVIAPLVMHAVAGTFDATVPTSLQGTLVAATGSRATTVLVSVGCVLLGLLSAALPAYHCRPGVSRTQPGAQSAAMPRLRHQAVIIVPQVALTTAVMMIAAAVAVSVMRIERSAPGYDVDKIAYARFIWPFPSVCRQDASTLQAAFRDSRIATMRILTSLSEIDPGRVAVSSATPFVPFINWIVPRDGALLDRFRIATSAVSAGYKDVLGLTLLRGRFFDGSDTADGSREAVISAAVARHLWPDDPIGKQIAFSVPSSTTAPTEWMTVIGVVSDVRTPASEGDVAPWVYTPVSQGPGATFALLRSQHVDASLIRRLQDVVSRTNTALDVSEASSVAAYVAVRRYPQRFAAIVLGVCCLLTAWLACMGLYGAASYSTLRHARDFGICMALGAPRWRVARMALREGLMHAALGVGGGVLLGTLMLISAAHVIGAMPRLGIGAICLLTASMTAVLVLASFGPARLATSVDVSRVLRQS